MKEFFKASAQSSPNSLAGAITCVIREGNTVEIQAVGAGAVNQAIKAIAIARGFLAPTGIDLSCCPTFSEVVIGAETKTAIRISVTEKLN